MDRFSSSRPAVGFKKGNSEVRHSPARLAAKELPARSAYRLRNPAPWKRTGPPKLALMRPMASLSHRMGEGRGEGARFNSPSLFQPRRRIRISEAGEPPQGILYPTALLAERRAERWVCQTSGGLEGTEVFPRKGAEAQRGEAATKTERRFPTGFDRGMKEDPRVRSGIVR